MLSLQQSGCHNINFVTPSHQVHAIVEAVVMAAEAGLSLPLVYNTGGYDSLETLRLLDGLFDIYMPDLKFMDPLTAAALADADDYPEVIRKTIHEMHRQVGDGCFPLPGRRDIQEHIPECDGSIQALS
jgi:putative pyruvate formate lyase activating enzyme